MYEGQISLLATTAGAAIPLEASSSIGAPLTYTLEVGNPSLFSVNGSNLVVQPNHPVGSSLIQVKYFSHNYNIDT